MITPTKNECEKIVQELNEENPLLIKDTLERIKKNEPYYIFPFTISEVIEKFCEKRNLEFNSVWDHQIRGVNINTQNKYERTLFIAVVLWLYSPSVYKVGYRTIEGRKSRVLVPLYNVEDGVRHILWGVLGCNRERISQQVEEIAHYYHSNYNEFKDQVNDLLAYIKHYVKEKAVIEDEPKEKIELFQ